MNKIIETIEGFVCLLIWGSILLLMVVASFLPEILVVLLIVLAIHSILWRLR